ncbi:MULTISPECIES: TetR family transcriptional regulator [Corynebacterium]|uniref:TetR family transcriptional regulator n=2 Tax=Corynebacterium glucuronolyticum TaxID=39791 RepID=A0A7T4JU47_9CORY|nr:MULTISPECIES: TetR/AcrR family transcriptional regulator C-terminal domain-containing protein [Corynebacterium]EEI26773.1 transcriptional regulator, TetR family [Corynebacterium glucuronolyticum ATCC 51867]EEI61952.1 transcriptional regulator, TetR family [Corynebacterium glucuronolyticum ATCC 51866]MCT1441193.1 TetR/AcrR family transcriptional regulator C-terminal domain-containing protein [Corynebacterium glucuronolyticum]OFO43673.1 TetR family transcriptional regulator [Corynebacterium sp
MHLDRDKIIAAGLEILDTYGLADMTIRRIAGKLNSAPGSIYWHVKNKQELIALIGHAIIDYVDTDQDTTADMLRELRRAMLQFRDGCEVVAAANNSGLVREDLIRLIRMPDESLSETAASTLLSFTLGHVQYEQFQLQLLALDAKATKESHDKGAARVAAKIADLQEEEETEANRLFEEGLETILRGISAS